MKNTIFILSVLLFTACSKSNQSKMEVTFKGSAVTISEFSIRKDNLGSSNGFSIALYNSTEEYFIAVDLKPNVKFPGFIQKTSSGIRSSDNLTGSITMDNGNEVTGTMTSLDGSLIRFDHYVLN